MPSGYQSNCHRSVSLSHSKSLAASGNLGRWLAASLLYETMQAAFFARRHLTKLISDRLLRQLKGLMIYNKIERVLVITKRILNYYNINFSLEITSKVQKVNQKHTFTHKLTTKRNFQTPSLFFSSSVTEWDAQDCLISKAAKDTKLYICLVWLLHDHLVCPK